MDNYSEKIKFNDGVKYRNENGQLHRTDGPAVEWSDGSKEWWINGKRHRTNGPALEFHDGDKEWWLYGIYISRKEFNNFRNSIFGVL